MRYALPAFVFKLVDGAKVALLAVLLEISVKLGTPDIKSMPVKWAFVQAFHNSKTDYPQLYQLVMINL
jgi:hypothetical protein